VALAGTSTADTRAEEDAMNEGTNGQDVVDVLTTDHREATSLIAQIWSTADADQRRDLADTLISELVRHSVAEEMYVYPAMKKHLPDGDEAVQHDTEEHKELEATMKELEAVDAGETRFEELVRKLETTLRDHISDEEADQFPQLRARVPREELVEMAGKVEGAKKLAPTRPHPSAPNAAVFHKLVGPGVGLVDRLRDKLTGRSTG
jgi:hemerythrin superfamily protein